MTQLTITTIMRLDSKGNIVESYAHKEEQQLYNVQLSDGMLLTNFQNIDFYTRGEAIKKAKQFKGKIVKSTT